MLPDPLSVRCDLLHHDGRLSSLPRDELFDMLPRDELFGKQHHGALFQPASIHHASLTNSQHPYEHQYLHLDLKTYDHTHCKFQPMHKPVHHTHLKSSHFHHTHPEPVPAHPMPLL